MLIHDTDIYEAVSCIFENTEMHWHMKGFNQMINYKWKFETTQHAESLNTAISHVVMLVVTQDIMVVQMIKVVADNDVLQGLAG